MKRIVLNRLWAFCLVLLSATVWTACDKDATEPNPDTPETRTIDDYEASLARSWMDMAYNTVKR